MFPGFGRRPDYAHDRARINQAAAYSVGQAKGMIALFQSGLNGFFGFVIAAFPDRRVCE